MSLLLNVTKLGYSNNVIVDNHSKEPSSSAIITHQEWYRLWGYDGDDVGKDVATDGLNNVYITGRCYNESSNSFDIVIVKYDSSGSQIWNRTWGGNQNDYGMCIVVDAVNVYVGVILKVIVRN